MAYSDKTKSFDMMESAFDYYVKLGTKRTVEKVAKKYGKSVQTVRNWSSRNKWKDRIGELNMAKKEHLAERLKHQVIANAEKLTDFKLQTLWRMIERIDLPETTVHEMGVIMKWIKVELGEPTDITKGTVQDERANPFGDAFDKFLSAKDGDS